MQSLYIGAEGRVTGSRRGQNPAPELLGLDHVYLTVSDFARSRRFYDRVMKALGFKKGTSPIGTERHCHYYNRNFQISIRPARSSRAHDPYAPGLHHLCFRVANNGAVDGVARKLRTMGVPIEGPQLWPEYAPDYYAVFLKDPDGIRLEVMNYRRGKKLVRRLWKDLEGFVNPVDRLMRRRGGQ